MTGAQAVCGGIATVNRNLLRAILDLAQRRKGTLSVISYLEGPGARPSWLPESVSFKPCSGNKIRFSIALWSEVFRTANFVFDHVTLVSPLLPLAIPRLINTVILAHGSESWKRIRPASRFAFSVSSKTLTNSHYTLRKMRQTLKHFRGEACPLGLSPDIRLRHESTALPDDSIELPSADGSIQALSDQFLLLVARIDSREMEKGHAELIEVLPHLKDRFPRIQLVFPGPGDGRDALMRLAVELGVARRVFVPGFVDANLLDQLYAKCFAFVMPSKQEGFGLVYLEAMNYAKPCIGCRDDGAEDVILPYETGLLIDGAENHDQLLEAICHLLENTNLARQYGENGFERLHRFFTAEKYQERIISSLEELG